MICREPEANATALVSLTLDSRIGTSFSLRPSSQPVGWLPPPCVLFAPASTQQRSYEGGEEGEGRHPMDGCESIQLRWRIPRCLFLPPISHSHLNSGSRRRHKKKASLANQQSPPVEGLHTIAASVPKQCVGRPMRGNNGR